tara:strand:- start:22 stop:306 length:285 start_codon:yes stop_codon:yes gene_type:complete
MTASNPYKYYSHNKCETQTVNLNNDQYRELKELYVERLVDNMSTKDLVRYVTDDMSDWVDSLSEHDFLDECNNYWDDGLDEIIEEVMEIHPNKE